MSDGNLLPVHCCCNPETRLGWVPVPAHSQRVGERLHFLIRREGAQLTGFAPLRGDYGTVEHRPAEVIDTSVGELFTPPANATVSTPTYEYTRSLAVKSAHHPIETWRKVPGFVDEAVMVRLRSAFIDAATQGGVLERG